MSAAIPTVDSSNLNVPYAGTTIIPDIAITDTTNRSNGLLTKEAINQQIIFLKSQNVLPNDNDAPDVYQKKMTAFVVAARREYGYYYGRYTYALTVLFNKISATYGNTVTSDMKDDIRHALTNVTKFNTKLNDILSIVQVVSANIHADVTSSASEVTYMMTMMLKNKEQIEQQNKMIKSNQASALIRKEMVKYTEEKSRYNDNLLKVYSFLNIVALGVLLYIYKAAPE